MIHFFHEFIDSHDRRNVLLYGLLLYADAFWREEMAELKRVTGCRLQGIHRQKLNWLVDFLFGFEVGAKAAGRAFAEPIQGEEVMGVPEIRVEELKKRLDAGEDLFLLDVRDEYEYEISNIGGQLIPLPELAKRVNELDVNLNIVTVCKMGARGVKAAQVLHNAGFPHVWNLTGGIHAWSDKVDHSVRKY
jgi:adenylyltransferase/sulfurtransferase